MHNCINSASNIIAAQACADALQATAAQAFNLAGLYVLAIAALAIACHYVATR